MSKQVLALAGLLAGSFAMVGCASTATGVSASTMRVAPGSVSLDETRTANTTLVVVRYPYVVEDDAEKAYYDAYFNSPIGGSLNMNSLDTQDARVAADSILLKSTYFALSLYDELRERLPADTVLLSPHALKLDANGELTSEPVTAAESLPSVLTVDYVSYTFPDASKMMGSQPLTFGDIVTPMVVVHTDHRAEPPTNGLLLSSAPMTPVAAGGAREEAMESLANLQAGTFETQPRELDYISFLKRDPGRNVASIGLSMTSETHAVQQYPLEKVLLDRYALSRLTYDPSGDVDPLAKVFSAHLAERVVDLLNDVDMEKAVMVQRAAAVARFDPNLAALTLVGEGDPGVETRFRFAERLLETERRFLSVQSQKMYDGIRNGEYGENVRELISAEYGVLQERRRLANQQNMATAVAVLGVVAAGVAASQGENFDALDYIALDLATDVSMMAVVQAISLNQQSKAVGRNFLTAVVPALEEQITVQVDLIDSSEEITAQSIEGLRERLGEMYAARQRSMDDVATSCAFNGTGGQTVGTWQGVCENGLANGAGVGVVRYDDGTALEYYGEAMNGQPEGIGYIVRHDAGGSYSIEGAFRDGEPDGVVSVSRAGQIEQLRLYDGGHDRGAAPAGAEAPKLFEPDTAPDVIAALATARGAG